MNGYSCLARFPYPRRLCPGMFTTTDLGRTVVGYYCSPTTTAQISDPLLQSRRTLRSDDESKQLRQNRNRTRTLGNTLLNSDREKEVLRRKSPDSYEPKICWCDSFQDFASFPQTIPSQYRPKPKSSPTPPVQHASLLD